MLKADKVQKLKPQSLFIIVSESWDITISTKLRTLNHIATLQTGDIRNNLKFVPSLILICPMF